ncbi:MAG: nicotinate-nucleotide adenylyltransferase [Thermodesulfovibrionales bacterium]
MKIGILGGTFNPIHLGHLRIAEEARERLGLDQVIFIPAGTPPLKTREIAPARHRLRMTRLAVLGNRFFSVLDVECARPDKSFTVHTLELLARRHAGATLYFLTGIDAFLDLPLWKDPERLLQLAHFVVLSRPGTRFTDLLGSPYIKSGRMTLQELDASKRSDAALPLADGHDLLLLRVTDLSVSSTAIREALKNSRSVKYLLPPKVESYIIFNKLYSLMPRATRPGGRCGSTNVRPKLEVGVCSKAKTSR